MRPAAGTLAEIAALAAIAVALALGGQAFLNELHVLGPLAVAAIAAALAAVSISVRRVLAEGADRLELTRRGAYLAGLILALWAVAAPARWNLGAAIAALEVALAFDLVTRLAGANRHT